MKRLLSLIAGVCFSVTILAQTNNIALYVYAPAQQESIPDASVDYLVNNLCSTLTQDGLAAQNEYMTQFLLVPKVSVTTKNILSTTQQQIVLTLDVALQVMDNISGTIYGSQTVSLKGVGTNETKAYNSAFKTLNRHDAKIKALASVAKSRIIDYYESEANGIIRKARLLAAQENFDEAFYLLSMIPSQCSKFDSAISAGLDVWEKYKSYSCAYNIGKARSAWVARQNADGARLAGMYLANIFPDAPCYADALQLYKDIKSCMGELWQYEMKHYDTEAELRMAKIQAWQAIGVAYGKGQQPGIIINKSKY